MSTGVFANFMYLTNEYMDRKRCEKTRAHFKNANINSTNEKHLWLTRIKMLDPDSICGTFIFSVESIDEYDSMILILDSLYQGDEKRLLGCLMRFVKEREIPHSGTTRESFRQSYIEVMVPSKMITYLGNLLEEEHLSWNLQIDIEYANGNTVTLTTGMCDEGGDVHIYASPLFKKFPPNFPMISLKESEEKTGSDSLVGSADISRAQAVQFLKHWKGFHTPIPGNRITGIHLYRQDVDNTTYPTTLRGMKDLIQVIDEKFSMDCNINLQ